MKPVIIRVEVPLVVLELQGGRDKVRHKLIVIQICFVGS
jgi:hypothetical protein